MTIHTEAIYEQGVLKPIQPLELAEGTRVEITIVTPTQARRTPYEILSTIAALPLEVTREEHGGREHDSFLYGHQDSEEQP